MPRFGISWELHFDHWPLILGLILLTIRKNAPFPNHIQFANFCHSTPSSCHAGCRPAPDIFSQQTPVALPGGISRATGRCPPSGSPEGLLRPQHAPQGAPQHLFAFYLQPVGAGSPGLLLPAGEKRLAEGDALRAPASSVPGRTQPGITGTVLQAFTGA